MPMLSGPQLTMRRFWKHFAPLPIISSTFLSATNSSMARNKW
ncbi:hypothetical protein [Lysobacter gummosus]